MAAHESPDNPLAFWRGIAFALAVTGGVILVSLLIVFFL